MFDAKVVAKYIINFCNDRNIRITNLRLQKLLYFSWIEHYKSTKEPLFDNPISAWKLGPVVADVYYEYCIYAGLSIPPVDVDYDEDSLHCLDKSLSKYAHIDVFELVDITHQPGKPWAEIFQDGVGNRKVIPFERIIELECKA